MTNQYLEEKVFELEKRVEKIELSKIINDLPSINKPCEDAISREAALIIAGTHTLTVEETIKAIERLPSVIPSRRNGHWIPIYQGDEIINYRCSECELGDTNGSINLYGWDYCRRCGAKMESEEV